MSYSYKTLSKMVKEAEQKANSGLLRPEEAALATAAAYATDLMDIGSDTGNMLDLTIMSEEGVLKCLMAAHVANMRSGKTIDESRENLIKLLGGYELFAIPNSMNKTDKAVEIVVLRSVMTPEIKLVIDTVPLADGKTFRFDVYDAARQVVSEFKLGDLQKDGDAFFVGRMLTFHNRLMDELLSKLVK